MQRSERRLLLVFSQRYGAKACEEGSGEGPARKLLLENEVFDVSPLVLVIWDLCDGKNEKTDICRAISQKARVGHEDIEPIVDEVLVALEKVKLVGFD